MRVAPVSPAPVLPPSFLPSTARNVPALGAWSRIDAFCAAFHALRRKSMAIHGAGG
jgi:hypothetical protein